MNKIVKLPLFLGICGAACATVLASLFALTNPIVQKNNDAKAAEAYLSMYEDLGVTKDEIKVEGAVTLSDELFNAGCTGRAVITKDSVKGAAYTCSFKGYGGQVDFQIAFANGKYLAFNALKHGETAQGKAVMDELPKIVNGQSMNDSLSSFATVVTKSSYTGAPINKIVDICRADYASWLETL